MKHFFKLRLLFVVAALLATIVVAGLTNRSEAATGTSITSYGPFVASNTATRLYRFEPSSAAGSTWATSWNDTGGGSNWFLSTWDSGAGQWRTPINIASILGFTTPLLTDAFLSWDSAMSRFVLVVLENRTDELNNVWYCYSTDANGTSWLVGNSGQPVISSNATYMWDYPSIGVDASGRIVVGAYLRNSQYSFWSVVSSNHGATFTTVNPNSSNSGRIAAASSSSPFRSGRRSRIVATDSKFEAFMAQETAFASGIPLVVERYESTDGVNWSFAETFPSFGAPLNNSDPNKACAPGGSPCGPIFYAPGIDAKGTSAGAWVMTVPVNYNGYNNVMMCASTRGCGLVNAGNDDQFMAGTSVSTDGRFWVSYLTYSTLDTRALPLIKQSIFFPYSTGGGVGDTVDTNVDPGYWIPNTNKCSLPCFTSGDYATISSNPYAATSTPYTKQVPDTSPPSVDQSFNHLQQIFSVDPPGPRPATNFTPNTIWFPPGTKSIEQFAKPVPFTALGVVDRVGLKHILPGAPPLPTAIR